MLLCLAVSSDIARCQQIMSYEEYRSIDHAEPYVVRLETPRGALVYFGSRHSTDPTDPQMDSLAAAWTAFKPDLVLTEGVPRDVSDLTPPDAIRRYGEFGRIWGLAGRDSIPVRTLEPDRGDEVNYLVDRGWTDRQIMLFYTLRQVAQSNRQGKDIDISAVVPEYLSSLTDRFDLHGLATVEQLETAVDEVLPSVSEWQEITDRYFYPGPQEPGYFTNKIATDSNRFRDEHHVSVIVSSVREGRRVFAVVGSAHVVMQEPALRNHLRE